MNMNAKELAHCPFKAEQHRGTTPITHEPSSQGDPLTKTDQNASSHSGLNVFVTEEGPSRLLTDLSMFGF